MKLVLPIIYKNSLLQNVHTNQTVIEDVKLTTPNLNLLLLLLFFYLQTHCTSLVLFVHFNELRLHLFWGGGFSAYS